VGLHESLEGATGRRFRGEVFRFRVRSSPAMSDDTRHVVFTALGNVSWLETGDLNLDGRVDVVYATENGATVDILAGIGDGSFRPDARIDVGQTILGLALADTDADGDLDVLAGTIDRARLFENTGTEDDASGAARLQFEAGGVAVTGAAVRELAAGDLDHRGAPDIVLSTDEGLQVRLNGLDSPAATLGTGRVARTGIALADLDLDGHLDLLFGSQSGGRLTVYLSDYPSQAAGAVPFVGPTHVGLETDAEEIAVGNLVGDAFPEVLILTAEAATLGGAFRLVEQEEGEFRVEPLTLGALESGAGGPGDVLDSARFALGDLDGDGLPDLILSALLAGKIYQYRNTGGAPPFAGDGTELLTASRPSVVRAADLTGDGVIDILAASGSEIHALIRGVGEPPPPPEDTFRFSIDSVEVRQGDQDASAIVRLTNTSPLDGYTAVVAFDPAAVTPLSADIEGTVTGASEPEFTSFAVAAADDAFSFSVLVDALPPLEGKVIAAGENQVFFRLHFDVPEEATLGSSTLAFVDGVGEPPLSNTVVAGGESIAPETAAGVINVLPADDEPPSGGPNRLELGTVDVAAGAEGALPVFASSDQNIDGFTVIVTHDPAVFEILSLDLTGSVTESLLPELVIPVIRADEGNLTLTVIFDFLPPFLRQSFPPGEHQLLFTIRFRAHADALPGSYPFRFQNGIGTPPLNNIFVFSGQSFFPDLFDGAVRVGDGGATFIRGDTDGDGTINITDAVAISNYLFVAGPPPACFDAADVNDSGKVNLTDSIYLLNYLSDLGPPPVAPFPDPGPDPTADVLDC
jgi:hypothetical protein